MNQYLESTEYIDWKHPAVAAKAAELAEGCDSEEGVAKRCFEFVRDVIKHSWDYRQNPVNQVARLLFDLPVTGDFWALLIATPLYAAAHLILGFAFSALAESQMQAIQGAVFFYLPSMLLSGFMFPFQGMPTWARTIGEVLPLTHFVRAARGVLLKGEDASFVVCEMVPVALFALVTASIALAAYRCRID